MGDVQQTAPQPKTLSYSRDDVLNNLQFFFGDPVSPEKLRDYSEHHALTYHFPDAYYGQNTKIRDTLNNLILKAPQEWQTSVGLPFVRIEGANIEWDELRFDVRLLQRVPYEGVSRMQTSLRRRHRDRVVRRGIGMVIESDFYATDAGRDHFRNQLTGIRYCVQETCNFDVLHAYLTTTNYDFHYDLDRGLRTTRSVRTAMAHDVLMYAIAQKEGLGFDRAVEEAKYRMSRYQVTPNMLILPPQLLLYLSMGPEEKIKFFEGGERAVTRFEEGPAGYEAKAFRGLGIFQSLPYEESEEAESVQMLERTTQVGEYYTMSPPAIQPGGDGLVRDVKGNVIKNYMDILIYNEETDSVTPITFEQALRATGLTRANDDDSGISLTSLYGDDTQTIALLNAALTKAELPDDIKTKWGAAGNDISKVADPIAVLVAAVANGYWIPVCITIARPFIEHVTLSAIVTVSGRDTGATVFGPADMQVSANTSVKTIEGHYTCHTKAVITKPQNVFIMRDVMCTGYVAGCNTRFFGTPEGEDMLATRVTSTTVQSQLSERLAASDSNASNIPSLLAFFSIYREGKADGEPISLSSRVLPWSEPLKNKEVGSTFPGKGNVFKAYNTTWNLGQLHEGEDRRASENMAFVSAEQVKNSLCFVGPHRKFAPWSAKRYELVPGQGHFGADAVAGDARWRRGEAVDMRAARAAMQPFEMATSS